MQLHGLSPKSPESGPTRHPNSGEFGYDDASMQLYTIKRDRERSSAPPLTRHRAMPSVDPKRQRKFAAAVVSELRRAGHESYWAGGCVRDQLLGQVPKDYDVATSATPDEICQVFGQRRTLTIGAVFGVVTVLGPQGAGQVEVATFRQDAGYSDGRHPDAVIFSTPEQDARRRDFTINGLFYDPEARRVIDFVGGQHDLRIKTIRAIGDARMRFEEDKLRMLRAVRFAATLQFALEEQTLRAVQEMAPQLVVVSAERIGAELGRMLTHPTRACAMRLLRESGLLDVVLPEFANLCRGADGGHIWSETLRVLDQLQDPSIALALAGLLHLANDASLVEITGRRWRLARKCIDRATWLVRNYPHLTSARTMPWPRLQRLLIKDGIQDLLALHEAMASSQSPELVYCRQKLDLPPLELNPPPLLTGDDLKAHGLQPGRHFQRLLDEVRDAQLEKRIHSREEALILVDQLLAGGQ
jgi:tRNA nucleotidyltransferase/poly(A) polymerase